MHILMIEDNAAVAEMLGLFFRKEGWHLTVIPNGQDAVKTFTKTPDNWDFITLDLNLPGMDGMRVATTIREYNKKVPLLMLTARDSESDQVLGLEIGADDYIIKPFSPIVLVAKMKAILRRLHYASLSRVEDDARFDVMTDHFKLDTSTREVYVDNVPIADLTPKEFDLLRALAEKPHQVFSREQLLQMVWGYEFFGDERTVDAHIKKLRAKMPNSGSDIIQTVWGVGYKFDDQILDN